jgi:hypothetical protein
VERPTLKPLCLELYSSGDAHAALVLHEVVHCLTIACTQLHTTFPVGVVCNIDGSSVAVVVAPKLFRELFPINSLSDFRVPNFPSSLTRAAPGITAIVLWRHNFLRLHLVSYLGAISFAADDHAVNLASCNEIKIQHIPNYLLAVNYARMNSRFLSQIL